MQCDEYLRQVMCRESGDCLTTTPAPCVTLSKKAEFNGFMTADRDVSRLPHLIRQCRSSLFASMAIIQILVCCAITQLATTLLLFHNNDAYLSNVQYLYIDLALVFIPALVSMNHDLIANHLIDSL